MSERGVTDQALAARTAAAQPRSRTMLVFVQLGLTP